MGLIGNATETAHMDPKAGGGAIHLFRSAFMACCAGLWGRSIRAGPELVNLRD